MDVKEIIKNFIGSLFIFYAVFTMIAVLAIVSSGALSNFVISSDVYAFISPYSVLAAIGYTILKIKFK